MFKSKIFYVFFNFYKKSKTFTFGKPNLRRFISYLIILEKVINVATRLKFYLKNMFVTYKRRHFLCTPQSTRKKPMHLHRLFVRLSGPCRIRTYDPLLVRQVL